MASNSTSSLASASTGETAFTITRTETVPAGVRVYHFDELSEATQQVFAEIDGRERVVRMTEAVANEFTTDALVVFDDYYRIDVP
ncbi:hypothetical protein BG842_25785 [Haladaptatus sp. W1]|uniref:hypothetical protein n=1 Tax=Haladaptatus sp. W1 TaxID=1897478 RepID=UPI0008497286|nr:hypothetical protein [Haladaptatus sp. W1]ODR81613.1 hypothetical protein BG842_25295 [Haladaptatus sp. W1]ODR83331.1 hypothetical protein BG842_25785 [Haladaptatus sp. W1]